MTSDKILSFYRSLAPPEDLPKGVEVMHPYVDEKSMGCTTEFYEKYFRDDRERVILFGINPGRFGGGVTGIPFTDPVQLTEVCDIENTFEKRSELSSGFIYEMIGALGGPEQFYASLYISAVCPLGFVRDGKNLNYYDDKELQTEWEPFFVSTIREQMAFCSRKEVFSIGMGANEKYLKYLNKKYDLFEQITPLPHPRWVMQYRLKKKHQFIEEYRTKLAAYL